MLLEKELRGDIDLLTTSLERKLLRDYSIDLEEKSDIDYERVRQRIRVFSQYSQLGQNSVYITLVLLKVGNEPIYITATVNGKIKGMHHKENTTGIEMMYRYLDRLLR